MSDEQHPLLAFQGEPETAAIPEKPGPARGVDAPRKYAVHYQGPWETEHDGVNEAVRRHACALAATGIPVHLSSFTHNVRNRDGHVELASTGAVEPAVLNQVRSLLTTEATYYCPQIKHLVASDASSLLQWLLPRSVRQASSLEEMVTWRRHLLNLTIVFSVWERDSIPLEMGQILSEAWNWVPSLANKKALVASGVPEERILVVPHPFDPYSPLARMEQRPELPPPLDKLKPATKRFYSIGKWEPRKGLDKLLAAFLCAYGPNDDATLVIKTTDNLWPEFLTPEEALDWALSLPEAQAHGWTMQNLGRSVRLIARFLPLGKISELHFRSNIYVSAAHAEGFGLPAYDAKVAGNRMVYLEGSGGPDDFSTAADEKVFGYDTGYHPSYNWDSDWVNYDVNDLVIALKKVEAPTSFARPPHFAECFGAEAVGRLMRNDVLRVAAFERGCREELENS